eukprot:scaffold78835_cov42-Phaeocystis_antarctica.AAC.1
MITQASLSAGTGRERVLPPLPRWVGAAGRLGTARPPPVPSPPWFPKGWPLGRAPRPVCAGAGAPARG